jgi:hypothetical protein
MRVAAFLDVFNITQRQCAGRCRRRVGEQVLAPIVIIVWRVGVKFEFCRV